MVRSPFFCLLILMLLFSCKKETTTRIKSDSFKKEAKALQQKAVENLEKSNFNRAFYYFNKSKITFETYKDSANVAFNLIQMAYIQQINGDYYGSKETLTEALPYVKNDNNYIVAVHNFFGIADKELSIYDDAIFYYKEAINHAKDSVSIQSPLNNIAVVYIKQKQYNKAISTLELILNSKVLNDPQLVKGKARVLDNLGFAYFKKGLKDKGLQFITKSLELRKQAGDDYGSIESYFHLADYFSASDRDKSNRYALTAYQIATKFNSIDERLRALSFLVYNHSNNKYAQKYITLNDSIISIRNNFKNKFAKIKYDSKKEKDENQKLRLEKAENLLSLQKAKYQKIVSFIGIIFLVTLLFILMRYYRNKNRIEKIQASYETETRIAKKIHDELANDVFHTMTFIQTQSLQKEYEKESLLEKLDQIYSRVRRISRENNAIDIGIYYSKNLKEMLSTYNNDSINVIVNSIEKINWDAVDRIKKVTLYRVLQELMVNMKKHSNATIVVLKFEENQNIISIDYVDNGKGCILNEIFKNGLQNMENRIIAIKGTIIFDSEPENGFKVKISIPK
jgi:signal transduction histidine kinase